MRLPDRSRLDIRRLDSADPGIGLGRPALLREVNAREILRLLRLHSPCSRADLVRYSGLSAPTVSSSITFLQRKGFVETIGAGVSSGGRPPRLLQFNSRFGYVAGVDIGGSVLRVALADLGGTILGKWVAPVPSQRAPERVVSLVRSGIRQLLKGHNIPSKRLLTIGAGAPGITDTQAGIVRAAPNLSGWQDVPLRRMLEEKIGIRAAVENDVNLGALGESWCGTARGVRDFVFLAIGTGVGAGIFVDGHLYHGSDWSAGEVGYLYVPGTEEIPLALLRPGPLETLIGGRGIERSWQELHNGSRRRARSPRRRLRATEIFDLATAGDPRARAVLKKTARVLADAIVNLSAILNCSLIVLGGGIGTHPALLEATRQLLRRNDFVSPQLAVSLLGQDAQLLGAVWLAINTAEANILP